MCSVFNPFSPVLEESGESKQTKEVPQNQVSLLHFVICEQWALATKWNACVYCVYHKLHIKPDWMIDGFYAKWKFLIMYGVVLFFFRFFSYAFALNDCLYRWLLTLMLILMIIIIIQLFCWLLLMFIAHRFSYSSPNNKMPTHFLNKYHFGKVLNGNNKHNINYNHNYTW